ncbi:hypothetical protein [Pseudoxanthomonas winnipegensis]|uniref:Uncharacterized protein n=1 Tax=Pseudoxanthomonas winnipegensis TaxID=2480810 RepID=A0A4Q8L6D7_9GAMM|nr:hypothetical protein [Pseudoxanthomonas winnipegensis]TAA21931.1 hypothetical protein EA660_16395 [Pseudoxanthomonas winnipegensis]
MTTFVFRSQGQPTRDSLVMRVITALTELEIDGAGIELLARGIRAMSDDDGGLVIADVSGPPGWQTRAGALLARHGLRCLPYAA